MGFEAFAVVELMGHAKIAGKVTEQVIAGVAMLRVDVPKTSKRDGYTKFYSAGALYCLTPCDEATAQRAAEAFDVEAISPYILHLPTSPMLAEKVERWDDEDDFVDEDDDPDYDEDGYLVGLSGDDEDEDEFDDDPDFVAEGDIDTLRVQNHEAVVPTPIEAVRLDPLPRVKIGDDIYEPVDNPPDASVEAEGPTFALRGGSEAAFSQPTADPLEQEPPPVPGMEVVRSESGRWAYRAKTPFTLDDAKHEL